MTKVLHITAHLGGGVGRVLSRVVTYNAAHATGIEDRLLCLEAPEKTQFVDAITQAGVPVLFDVTAEETRRLIAEADIVQLEWWHHPLMLQWLHQFPEIACRLVVWAHTSGLHYPALPHDFVALPHAFMATAAASGLRDTVASSGGFDDIPQRTPAPGNAPRHGYIGSLNAAKLHPRMMDYLAAAGDVRVKFYGSEEPGMPIHSSAQAEIMGYTEDPIAALGTMDVFVYLLNPMHYGTTENALLEAMAAGVVPIVMHNPVEATIVRHGETGMIVDSPSSFAAAIRYLREQPEARMRMAAAAAADVRARYSLPATIAGLQSIYDRVMQEPKRNFTFQPVFGDTSFDWFYAGLGTYAPLFAKGGEDSNRAARQEVLFLYEKSKSSLAHFLRYFPKDDRLHHWAGVLNDDQRS